MSPLSGGVLGAAAVVSSPALWLSLVEGTMPLQAGLTRYLVSVVICWAALSIVAAVAFPEPGSVEVAEEPGARSAAGPEHAEDGAVSS